MGKFKEELEELCEEIEKGNEEPKSLIDFFFDNREEFFKHAKDYNEIEETGTLQDAYSKAEHVITCLTCSCGSTINSCQEDGQGKYSTFYVTSKANIIRQIVRK